METWGNNNEDSHQISETRDNRIHVEEVITFILVAKSFNIVLLCSQTDSQSVK